MFHLFPVCSLPTFKSQFLFQKVKVAKLFSIIYWVARFLPVTHALLALSAPSAHHLPFLPLPSLPLLFQRELGVISLPQSPTRSPAPFLSEFLAGMVMRGLNTSLQYALHLLISSRRCPRLTVCQRRPYKTQLPQEELQNHRGVVGHTQLSLFSLIPTTGIIITCELGGPQNTKALDCRLGLDQEPRILWGQPFRRPLHSHSLGQHASTSWAVNKKGCIRACEVRYRTLELKPEFKFCPDNCYPHEFG